METKNKNILEEMLSYLKFPKKTEKYNYLKLAIEEGEKMDGIYHFIADLINWLDPIMLKLPDIDIEKIQLRGNEGIDYDSYINGMNMFFKHCPELKQIFELKDDVVYFNSSLSKKEQEEIRQFVDKNRIRKVTNFYIPVDKTKK